MAYPEGYRLEATIGKRSAELRAHYPGVRECRVTIVDRPPHIYERRRYNVRLDIAVAGHDFVINREDDQDPAVALEDAFSAAHRKLDALAG